MAEKFCVRSYKPKTYMIKPGSVAHHLRITDLKYTIYFPNTNLFITEMK